MKTPKPLLVFVITLVFSANALSQFSDGLVAYYPFDGNAQDQSGNDNHGVVSGPILAADRFGIPNSAYYFAGDGSDISVSDSPSLDMTNEITLSAWIRVEAGATAQPRILHKHVFDLGLNDTSETPQVFLNIQNYPSGGATIITSPVDGSKWTFLAGTYDRHTVRLYTNGAVAAQLSATVPLDTNDLPIGIGGNPESGWDWFKGYIDDVRIYNRALSPEEIARLYAIESVPPLPYLNLTITLTLYPQGVSQNNGVVTTILSPKPVTFATKDILNVLAVDEHLQGNWPSNSFPTTAKLAIAGRSLIIADGTNALLNVSDIMRFTLGENEIISGSQNNATGLASKTIQKRQIARITFDDTFIVGGRNLRFYFQGVLTQSTTDTAPFGGVYTEVRIAKITNAAGEGSSRNVPFVCTGTAIATGKSTLAF